MAWPACSRMSRSGVPKSGHAIDGVDESRLDGNRIRRGLMMKRFLSNLVEWLRVKGAIRKTRARERAAEEIDVRREMERREAQDPIYKSPHDS